MIIFVLSVILYKTFLDYMNYRYLKHTHALRVFSRRSIRRFATFSIMIWLFFDAERFSTVEGLLMPVLILYITVLVIDLLTRKYHVKYMIKAFYESTLNFIKDGVSALLLVGVIWLLFLSSFLANIAIMMLFILSSLILIYLIFFKVFLPRVFRFIPYRMRSEDTLMFKDYPNLNQHIFMAQSKKVRLPMNALFMQGFKSLKVVLSDALLSRLNSREIKGIVAHELGHGARRHLWIRAGVMVIVVTMYLLVGSLVFDTEFVDRIFNDASVIKQLFILMVLYYPLENMILIGLYQLTQWQEYQSDEYAFELGYGEDLANALEKISRYQPDPKEHPLTKRLNLSHPDTMLRVKNLRTKCATLNN